MECKTAFTGIANPKQTGITDGNRKPKTETPSNLPESLRRSQRKMKKKSKKKGDGKGKSDASDGKRNQSGQHQNAAALVVGTKPMRISKHQFWRSKGSDCSCLTARFTYFTVYISWELRGR